MNLNFNATGLEVKKWLPEYLLTTLKEKGEKEENEKKKRFTKQAF